MIKSEKNKKPFGRIKNNSYTNGFLDGERNIIKKLFTLEIITIEKIAEIKLSIEEIHRLTIMKVSSISLKKYESNE